MVILICKLLGGYIYLLFFFFFFFFIITCLFENFPGGPVSTLLISILNHIEGKEFQIQDPKDTFFFVTAMDVCCNHLKVLYIVFLFDSLYA